MIKQWHREGLVITDSTSLSRWYLTQSILERKFKKTILISVLVFSIANKPIGDLFDVNCTNGQWNIEICSTIKIFTWSFMNVLYISINSSTNSFWSRWSKHIARIQQSKTDCCFLFHNFSTVFIWSSIDSFVWIENMLKSKLPNLYNKWKIIPLCDSIWVAHVCLARAWFFYRCHHKWLVSSHYTNLLSIQNIQNWIRWLLNKSFSNAKNISASSFSTT